GVVLEDEIAKAVEDGTAIIDLDAEGHMRAVADDDIRSGVNRLTCKRPYELRRCVEFRLMPCAGKGLAGDLVEMEREDDPVRLPLCFADHRQIGGCVRAVDVGCN